MAAPLYVSTFQCNTHPCNASIASIVQAYILEHWPWESDAEKQSYLEQDLDICAGFCAPSAETERVIVLGKWFVWGFLIDDRLEMIANTKNADWKGPAQLARFLDILSGKTLPDKNSGLEMISYDIIQSFSKGGEDKAYQLIKREIEGVMVTWFKEVLRAATSVESARDTEDLETLLKRRNQTGGVRALWPALRWVVKQNPPNNLEYWLRQIEDLASLYCILVNDLFSYHKEVRDSYKTTLKDANGKELGSIENVVAVTMKTKGMTESQAFEDIRGQLRNIEKEILRLEEEMDTNPSTRSDRDSESRYIEAIKAYLAGVVVWSGSARRYAVRSQN